LQGVLVKGEKAECLEFWKNSEARYGRSAALEEVEDAVVLLSNENLSNQWSKLVN
jgi:hypothetical protein